MNTTIPHTLPRWEAVLRVGAPHFQRGAARGRVKSAQRRILLRPKHIALSVLGLSLLIFGLSRVYLFAISWDGFAVKTVLLDCRVENARAEIEAALAESRLGNIFLLDIAGLKDALERNRWVGEAVIRRDFPATLKIEIRARRPEAVIRADGGLRLISRDGVILGCPDGAEAANLPVFLDVDGFRADCAEKLALAWACLEGLGPDERSRVESLDLSEFGTVVLILKGNPTRLILGGDRFPEKLALYREAETWLKSRLGELEYVDLRLFQDRMTVKQAIAPQEIAPQELPPAPLLPTSSKEAD